MYCKTLVCDNRAHFIFRIFWVRLDSFDQLNLISGPYITSQISRNKHNDLKGQENMGGAERKRVFEHMRTAMRSLIRAFAVR